MEATKNPNVSAMVRSLMESERVMRNAAWEDVELRAVVQSQTATESNMLDAREYWGGTATGRYKPEPHVIPSRQGIALYHETMRAVHETLTNAPRRIRRWALAELHFREQTGTRAIEFAYERGEERGLATLAREQVVLLAWCGQVIREEI